MLVRQIIQSFERKTTDSLTSKTLSWRGKSPKNVPTDTETKTSSSQQSSVKTKERTFQDLSKLKSTPTLTIPEVTKHTKLTKNYVSEYTLATQCETPTSVVMQPTPNNLTNLQQYYYGLTDETSSRVSQISDLTDTASWASSQKSFQDIDFVKSSKSHNDNGRTDLDNTSLSTIQMTPDLQVLKEFLLHICLNSSIADYYLKTLVDNNVRSGDELKAQVAKDQCYLLNLGFDYILARDISDSLLTTNGISSAKSVGGLLSLYSHKSVSRTSMKSGSTTKEIKELLPHEIAKLYYKVISSNSKESFRTIRQYADEKSNNLAKGYLMRIYALGQGGNECDLTAATKIANEVFPWLKTAASESHSVYNMYAKYLLGVCHSEGLIVPKNQKEAFLWYKSSAEQGYDAAQALLGHCFYTGQGVMKDTNEAVRWYRLAATQGFAAAQCNLGICYELGEGARRDMSEAVKWYKLAAEQGNCTAQYNLALSLESGVGVKNNVSQALKLYKLAAEQGHPTAQFKLGAYYFTESEHLELLEEEAFYWLGKSSAQGNAQAHGQLGLCYERGIGIEANIDQAIYYYQLGAERNDPASLYHLAHCYYTGLSGEKNETLAVLYYTKSAEKGHPPAQNNLGYCFFAGSGVPQNYNQAMKWYKASAEQGYAQAQFNLGFCYEQGYGTQQKPKEAIQYYRLAAAQGHSKAEFALKRLKAL
jgi:TPR repeat protein